MAKQIPSVPQYRRTNFNAADTRRLALLQSLHNTTKTPFIPSNDTAHDDTGNALTLAHLLAYAFSNDESMQRAFPDHAVQQQTISGEILPGLRQNGSGEWTEVSPTIATPQEQREYIRRNLMVNAAKSIVRAYGRSPVNLNQMAVQRPADLHHTHCLVKIATDICQMFDPQYLRTNPQQPAYSAF